MVDLCGGLFDHSEELKDRLRSRPDTPASAEASAEAVPVPASKWTLQRLQATFDWLHSYSLAGISLFVRAAGIKLRHGRPQYFSPDPAYQQKEAALFSALRHVSQQPGRVVALFVDELSYTRWPEPSLDWCAKAPEPRPLADRKHSRYQRYRVVGALPCQQRSGAGAARLTHQWRGVQSLYAPPRAGLSRGRDHLSHLG